MTIAVTAASGQLGSEIIKAVKALVGHDGVLGIARTPSNIKGSDVEIRPGDYNDKHQFDDALQGVNTLLLVSGMDAPDKRIVQHRNVIEAAKSAGVSKVVYTSVQGPERGTTFSPIVQSNRQTESDLKASGLTWVIGRNGIYIEPDVAYIDNYRDAGEIANSAGDGKCAYTTRAELAFAYARLLTRSDLDGQTLNLNGTAISQTQLAEYLNAALGTQLSYRPMSAAAYVEDRIAELGPFFGEIIAGIYDGIRLGAYDTPGDFEVAADRPHQSWEDYFRTLSSRMQSRGEETSV